MDEDRRVDSRFHVGVGEEGEYGCFMQCMLLYPSILHRAHEDYTLAPVKRKIVYSDLLPLACEMCDHHNLKRTLSKEKLLTTFETRTRYVLHYRNLQLYLKLGLRVVKFHAGLFFRQKRVMKDYVEFNSLRRSLATNDFDVDFYKLLSNSLFDKTIENPDKRRTVKLCRTKQELKKNIAKTTFKRSKIIDPRLVGVELRYSSMKTQ